jgi:hypothetical protein
MVLESIALAAAVAAFDPFVQPGYNRPNSGVRQIATPRPYPPAAADSVHRPGFAGRVWVGPVVMGGVEGPWAPDQGSPGPAAYGAHPGGGEQVYVRVGQLIVAINPWQELPEHGLKRFEAARQEWLAEYGYTNSVRTFMNDANFTAEHGWDRADAGGAGPVTSPDEIVPRAIIELAPDAPRFRSRMRVHATPARIIVLPADARTAAR